MRAALPDDWSHAYRALVLPVRGSGLFVSPPGRGVALAVDCAGGGGSDSRHQLGIY
jgi:hypothetical protein